MMPRKLFVSLLMEFLPWEVSCRSRGNYTYIPLYVVIYLLTSGEQSDSGNAAAPILSTGASRDDLIDLILSNWVLQLWGSHSILADLLGTFDISASLK